MSYILKTTEVKNKIKSIKEYPLVNLEWNVDGTACLLVKYADRKYYETKLSNENMKMEVDGLANHIVNCVESYFTGWGAKNGLR